MTVRTSATPILIAVIATLLFAGSAAAGTRKPPRAAGCPVFPASNVWNRRVDKLPVRADSETVKAAIGLDAPLHPDFGSWSGYGIPWNTVTKQTRRVKVRFRWPSESDAGPYPMPRPPKIERGSDRHLILVDRDRCRLFELFDVRRRADGRWRAGSGAIWNLRSNKLRPKGWTSADAAGLPILPGLVRYREVKAGAIRHALRFTAPLTRRSWRYPARHFASAVDGANLPPMGLRVRLKASVDISGYPRQARIVLRALKRYGMILADNGSAWYVTGAPHPGWNDDALHVLGQISGADFEVVDTRDLRNGK